MASTRGSMSYGAALDGIPTHQYPFNISSEVERTLRTIFKRCVQCPDENPTCPPCSNSEICSLVPTDCNTCAHMVCVRNPSSSTPSSGPNVGAIAGGVVGGVAFVGLVVFLLWYLWIRKKRAQQEAEAEEWEEDDIAQQKSVHHFQAMQQDAASTRTRGSFANSLLSRASNIIQIAYIPGVTNRNGSGHNSLMGSSPVPPIPAARRDMPRSPLVNDDGALFFRPGDLRDSTWSASSMGDKRDTQYSLTPSLARSSVTSGIYRDDGTEVPMPAQQIVRAAPRMVSVRSGSSHSPGETPGSQTPVSASDHSDFAANTPAGKGKGFQVMMPGERPNTSGSMQSSGSMKAQQITIGSKKGRFPVRQPSDSSTLTIGKHAPNVSSPLAGSEDSDDEEEDEHARARQSLINTSKEVSSPPAMQPVESPFFDASEKPSSSAQVATSSTQRPNPYKSMAATVGTGLDDRPKRGGRGMGGLSAVIEEATKRASRVPSHDGLGGKRDQSPFDDAHQID